MVRDQWGNLARMPGLYPYSFSKDILGFLMTTESQRPRFNVLSYSTVSPSLYLGVRPTHTTGWAPPAGLINTSSCSNLVYFSISIYAFSRCFYPKRLTIAFRLYIFISMSVPWESNPQPFASFALLTQCSTTEPHRNTDPGGFRPRRSPIQVLTSSTLLSFSDWPVLGCRVIMLLLYKILLIGQ